MLLESAVRAWWFGSGSGPQERKDQRGDADDDARCPPSQSAAKAPLPQRRFVADVSISREEITERGDQPSDAEAEGYDATDAGKHS